MSQVEKAVQISTAETKRKWLWRGVALAITAIIIGVVVAVVVVVVQRNQREALENGTDASINTTARGQSTEDQSVISKVGDLHALSRYSNLTLMETMQNDDLYTNPDHKLYVIGDVHGSLNELNTLVAKLQYNHDAGDRIILAGDLVTRGPDSIGVIRRAKELKALCVRGNHDDKVVRIKTFIRSGQAIYKEGVIPEGPVLDPLDFDNHHMGIAQNMTDEDYEYLSGCPMILAIPALQALFVHAGFNPHRKLEDQQPFSVMNIRTIEEDGIGTKEKSGEEWSDIWNSSQESNNSTFPPEYRKVYYGHAAGNGVQLKKYTFGVDSGCVYGRQLTALEIKSGQVTQVQCKEYYKN